MRPFYNLARASCGDLVLAHHASPLKVLFIFYSPFQFNAPQHAYLIYSLPQHLAHKLEELQVILMNIRCG